jgi:DNA-binding response OmpR family regulator
MRVLVVDDEVQIVNVVRRCFEGWGHEVHTATDGETAWRMFEASPFPMVITDWMMPALTGLDLLRRIRAHAQGEHVYAVMLTGRTDAEDVATGMEAGTDDFLCKPFDKSELFVKAQEGERIVQLERARRRAEARCSHMHALITRCSEFAERDLDEALGLLRQDAKDGDLITRISSARELVSLLRSDAEHCVREQSA